MNSDSSSLFHFDTQRFYLMGKQLQLSYPVPGQILFMVESNLLSSAFI